MLRDEQMLTVDRLAELWSLSPRYIRYLIEQGKLKGHRLGRARGLRVKWKDAKAFIESRAIQ